MQAEYGIWSVVDDLCGSVSVDKVCIAEIPVAVGVTVAAVEVWTELVSCMDSRKRFSLELISCSKV